MNPVTLQLPTLYGNWSRITLTLCEVYDSRQQILTGMIVQIGLPEATFSVSVGQMYLYDRPSRSAR